MQTECPDCKTVFRVTQSQLVQADGQVSCGQCSAIFSAHEQMIVVARKPSSVNPDLLKRMLSGRPMRGKWATAGWIACIVFMCLGLLLQLVYMERERLLRDERLGQYIVDLCQRIRGCNLSPERDLSRIQLISRNVYSHPNIEGVLMVNAVISNTASFNQPYPVLLISMSNVRGQVVAERYFDPAEYLSAETERADFMEPGKLVAVSLSVMDPGHDAMAFELDFL